MAGSIGLPTSNILTTYQSLLTTFSAFLTIAIHTIIYERAIYPAATFISTRAYNFPVRQNRHPKVCQWINDAVTAVEVEMLKGTVDKVAVVIFSPEAKVMERFMFDVSGFPVVPAEERYTEFDDENADQVAAGQRIKANAIDIEEQLRATARKLAYSAEKMSPLPEGCTFTVVVELKAQADPPIGHPQPWGPSQPSLQTLGKGKSTTMGADLGGVRTVPVRTVETGDFIMEMWIEEGKAKLEMSAGDPP